MTWTTRESPEEVAAICDRAFYAHDIRILETPFQVRYRVARLGPVTIGDITYGADVRLDFADSVSAYHVSVPLSGAVETTQRGMTVTAGSALASVLRPGADSTVMRWAGRALAVKIDTSVFQGPLPTLRDRIDLTEGHGRGWVNLLGSVTRQLFAPDTMLTHPLVAAPLAEALVNGFRMAAGEPPARGRPARRGVVAAATDLIDSAPDQPWTSAELARRCHVGVRTLQSGFQRTLGMNPADYVRLTRLHRAHDDLAAADPTTTTVATIARRWGFTHMSRFAQTYRATLGELPSTTLNA